jgi:hypothetical protein
MVSTLQKYRSNVYSQNGEDGVIAEILRRLNISHGWTCEVGAWDGRYGSNCYSLVKRGWPCVMIEADRHRYEQLRRLAARVGRNLIIPVCAYVDHHEGPSSLDSILLHTPLPNDFSLLSIDIDSWDYHVWEGFHRRPAIIIIEIDSSTLPGEEYTYSGGSRLTSFSAMLKLGLCKGYTLVCHTGNMIFVRDEDVGKLGLSRAEIDNPSSLFVHDWVNPTRMQVWQRKAKNLTPQRSWVKLVNYIHGM